MHILRLIHIDPIACENSTINISLNKLEVNILTNMSNFYFLSNHISELFYCFNMVCFAFIKTYNFFVGNCLWKGNPWFFCLWCNKRNWFVSEKFITVIKLYIQLLKINLEVIVIHAELWNFLPIIAINICNIFLQQKLCFLPLIDWLTH